MALTARWEHIFAFLLHTWLVAEGHDGLTLPADPSSSDAPPVVLSGSFIKEKVALPRHDES